MDTRQKAVFTEQATPPASQRKSIQFLLMCDRGNSANVWTINKFSWKKKKKKREVQAELFTQPIWFGLLFGVILFLVHLFFKYKTD